MSSLPEELFARYAGTMSAYARPWAMCGGWAIDAWLGRRTREHGDFDICVFDDDQQRLFEHLSDWHLIAHDAAMAGNSRDLWDGRRLQLPAHLHARPADERSLELLMQWVTTPFTTTKDGLDLDIQFNRRDGGEWLFSPHPRVALPLERATAPLRPGLPTAVPHVLLFYKATAYWGQEGHPRSHDLSDFLALLPLLERDALRWLGDAIAALVPGHPWLEHLP